MCKTQKANYFFSLIFTFHLLPSRFNPTSAGAGIAVPSIMMFASGFYIWGHAGSYAGDLSKLCHKCVTDVHKRLIIKTEFSNISYKNI
jgi:hypothetical protein